MKIKTKNIWVENADCLEFLKKIPRHSVDLILTDPPFGLNESNFDKKHYARNKEKVIDRYVEAPTDKSYEKWRFEWISKFDRVLKPNGSVMIFSGWSKVADIQYAIRKTKKYQMINHLIWHYNFGVATKNKFVSSHYHILYFCKNNAKHYFNRYAFHNEDHNTGRGSEVYKDIQDVIHINKKYKPKQFKNSNTLPIALIEKLIKHTTRIGDVVLDIFSGGFTTEFAALKLKRKAWGCELNLNSCKHYFPILKKFNESYIRLEDLEGFKKSEKLINQGKKLTKEEKKLILDYFRNLEGTKKDKILKTSNHFKRGYFSIKNFIDSLNLV